MVFHDARVRVACAAGPTLVVREAEDTVAERMGKSRAARVIEGIEDEQRAMRSVDDVQESVGRMRLVEPGRMAFPGVGARGMQQHKRCAFTALWTIYNPSISDAQLAFGCGPKLLICSVDAGARSEDVHLTCGEIEIKVDVDRAIVANGGI
jgi:hypothetical protein